MNIFFATQRDLFQTLTLASFLLALVITMLMISWPAYAIVGGEPDCSPNPTECAYPNVGAISLKRLSDGSDLATATASLIYKDQDQAVLLTVAHAGRYEVQYPDSFKLYFTFDNKAVDQEPGLPGGMSATLLRGVPISHAILHPKYLEALSSAGGNHVELKDRYYDVALLFITGAELDMFNEYWPDVTPITLPERNLLKNIGQATLKELGLTIVGYGYDEVAITGAAPPHTVRITNDGLRRIGKLIPSAAADDGILKYSENVNFADEYDGTASGDSGSPIFLGNSHIQIGVHKTSLHTQSVKGYGPRVDVPTVLDFICENLPSGVSACVE